MIVEAVTKIYKLLHLSHSTGTCLLPNANYVPAAGADTRWCRATQTFWLEGAVGAFFFNSAILEQIFNL